MNILYILIGCSFMLAVIFLLAYLWAVKSGQMDDDYTPSVRILFNDRPAATPDEQSSTPNQPNTNQ